MNTKILDELNVKRINIVDDDGTVRMVIANKESFPPPYIHNGKPVPREGMSKAGIVFYNDEGIECGGLTYAGYKEEKGTSKSQVLLSFDPYFQNDVIDIGLWEEDGEKQVFLSIHDRPNNFISDLIQEHEHMLFSENSPEKQKYIKELYENGEIGFERIRLMKSASGEAILNLNDSKGKPRIRLMVDANDTPKLEFLDEEGNVKYCLPPEK